MKEFKKLDLENMTKPFNNKNKYYMHTYNF